MAVEQIHFLRIKILETESYKKLSKIQKDICLKRNNIKAIENALNVIKNIGFDKWDKESNSNYLNKLIIKESPFLTI